MPGLKGDLFSFHTNFLVFPLSTLIIYLFYFVQYLSLSQPLWSSLNSGYWLHDLFANLVTAPPR